LASADILRSRPSRRATETLVGGGGKEVYELLSKIYNFKFFSANRSFETGVNAASTM